VADYLQRAARHLASKTDVEQSYAVGKAAVEMAVAGRNAVMPAITRVSDDPIRMEDHRSAARPGGQRREDAAARLHLA
jgi:6-phosphofructokinase 1